MSAVGKGRWTNFIALVLVNLMWAAQYPAYKVASDRMEPSTLNFWTLLIALVLLLPFWLLGAKHHRPTDVMVDDGRHSLRDFLLLGIAGIIPPSVLLSWGIAHSSAANASILSLTIPVLMTGMAILFLHERLTKMRGVGLLLGILGTLAVSMSDLQKFSLDTRLLTGNAVIVFAALGSAFYNTYSKRLLSRYSEIEILVFSYVIALGACAVLSLIWDVRPFYHVRGYGINAWTAIVVLGAISWGFAMVLWMWALNRLDVAQISISIYLLPFFGLLLSIWTIGDRVALPQILGGILTLIATAALSAVDEKEPSRLVQSE